MPSFSCLCFSVYFCQFLVQDKKNPILPPLGWNQAPSPSYDYAADIRMILCTHILFILICSMCNFILRKNFGCCQNRLLNFCQLIIFRAAAPWNCRLEIKWYHNVAFPPPAMTYNDLMSSLPGMARGHKILIFVMGLYRSLHYVHIFFRRNQQRHRTLSTCFINFSNRKMELSPKDPETQRDRRGINVDWVRASQPAELAAESSSGKPGLPANFVLTQVPDCQTMKLISQVSLFLLFFDVWHRLKLCLIADLRS